MDTRQVIHIPFTKHHHSHFITNCNLYCKRASTLTFSHILIYLVFFCCVQQKQISLYITSTTVYLRTSILFIVSLILTAILFCVVPSSFHHSSTPLFHQSYSPKNIFMYFIGCLQ